MSGIDLRAPIPGAGEQGLHPDFGEGRRTEGPWQCLAGRVVRDPVHPG